MPYDVFKFGHMYQVVDTGDNSPVGPLHKTRSAAWDSVMELQSEEALNETYGLGTVDKTVARAKVSPKQPGDTVGRSPKKMHASGVGSA